MGEVSVQIILQNFSDRALIAAGVRDSVRRHEMEAIVDTGSVMLALPQDVVEKLGLEQARTIVVTYAYERREERPVVAPVLLTVAGRDMILEAVVLPPTSPALLGQIPLEGMDLIVDCPKQTLGPRPESPIYPLLNYEVDPSQVQRVGHWEYMECDGRHPDGGGIETRPNGARSHLLHRQWGGDSIPPPSGLRFKVSMTCHPASRPRFAIMEP